MDNKYVMMFLMLWEFVILVLSLITEHDAQFKVAFTEGYKQAYKDYRNNDIDCIVKVKFPKWIEEIK